MKTVMVIGLDNTTVLELGEPMKFSFSRKMKRVTRHFRRSRIPIERLLFRLRVESLLRGETLIAMA